MLRRVLVNGNLKPPHKTVFQPAAIIDLDGDGCAAGEVCFDAKLGPTVVRVVFRVDYGGLHCIVVALEEQRGIVEGHATSVADSGDGGASCCSVDLQAGHGGVLVCSGA